MVCTGLSTNSAADPPNAKYVFAVTRSVIPGSV